jgi:hypothetical protein
MMDLWYLHRAKPAGHCFPIDRETAHTAPQTFCVAIALSGISYPEVKCIYP